MRYKSLRDLENSVAAKIAAEKRAVEGSDLLGLWGTAPLSPYFRAMAAILGGGTYVSSEFPCLSGILRPYRHPKDTLQ